MKNRKIIIAVMLIFAVSLCASFQILRRSEKETVEVVQDGAVLYVFDLNQAENQEIRVPSADGGYNLVVIKDGTVCISEADCSDQTCVKTGELKSDYLPIVCLPHKLIVRFAEGTA